MDGNATSLTEAEIKEIAQALFECERSYYESVEEAEEEIRGYHIFKVDHYVTDGPGYAGVLYVIVWGIPTACVLIRTPEGRLEVQTD